MALALLVGAWAFAGLGACAVSVEKAVEIPDGWRQLPEAPDAAHALRMSLALRHPKAHSFNKVFASGSYLSRKQVAELRTPSKTDVDAIQRWLADSGIRHTEADQDWVHVHTTVGEAEKLLRMKMHRYAFADQPPVVRTREYFIPDQLSDAIRFVHPIANFMTPEHSVAAMRPVSADEAAQMQKRQTSASGCEVMIRPRCIDQMYNMPQPKSGGGRTGDPPRALSRSRLAIAGFLEQYANYHDTREFFRKNKPELETYGYNFTVDLVNGGRNPQDAAKAGSEANLDVQYAMGIGYPVNMTYFSTGGKGVKLDESGRPIGEELSDNEPYLELIEHLLKLDDAEFPQVLSMSYADDEVTVPRPYAERVCDGFGMLAARGISVIVASGDGGARGGRNASCRTNDGRNTETAMATFPGTCPWTTAIGATRADTGNKAGQVTGAAFSIGGFSQWFPRPDWQSEAVEGYIKKLNGHMQGYYNPGMRAIPDVSAVGTQFSTVVGGRDMLLDGTSASAPIFAGMIALINHERLHRNKKPLGWLNKMLYSKEVRDVLLDVTKGRSKACEFNGKRIGSQSWPAKHGWDALTGLGVPDDFTRLRDVLVNMK